MKRVTFHDPRSPSGIVIFGIILDLCEQVIDGGYALTIDDRFRVEGKQVTERGRDQQEKGSFGVGHLENQGADGERNRGHDREPGCRMNVGVWPPFIEPLDGRPRGAPGRWRL